MSRQSKQRNNKILHKLAKGHNKGKHLAEGQKRSIFPSEQTKPCWVRPIRKKQGWWITGKVPGKVVEKSSS